MIVQCATISKSLNPQNIEERVSDINIRFPFESSFWISISSCKFTILPDIQPANRIVIISAAEVAGVTFSDSDSTRVPKFLNPGPDPAILQIWESDSCSDSGGNHRSNRNLLMFLLKKWPHRLLLLPKLKSDSGSERKSQNPAGVDSCTPDPVPALLCCRDDRIVDFYYPILSCFWKMISISDPNPVLVKIILYVSEVYYDVQHTFLCSVYFASWDKITAEVVLPLAEHDWLK